MLHRIASVLAGLLLALGTAAPSLAIDIANGAAPAPTSRSFANAALDIGPSLSDAHRDVTLAARSSGFMSRYGSEWEFRWDDRSDRPNVVQGRGIALIPGRGNALAPLDGITLDDVAARVRRFVDDEAELLRTKGLELTLDRERSVSVSDDFWSIELQQQYKGVPVDGAFVYARIAQGNIVQFGAERVAEFSLSTVPTLSREQAFERAWSELGLDRTVSEWQDRGELRIYPLQPAHETAGERYSGVRGAGYAHALAWRYTFRVDGSDSLWQLLVDAQTNRILDLRDMARHVNATLRGGIYPITNLEPEVIVEFPFAAISNGGAKVTDALGIYDYSGGTATTALDGKYFRMADNCGAISLSNSTDGNLNLGTSGGTNCTTPGFGGAGNTHASRTGFYHLSRINQKARSFLTTNSWLQGKVTANMNVTQTCNANWNGSAMNFFRSGTHATNPAIVCRNTGEIAAVFLHEWGHGMDQNAGGAANENGTGEATGDTFAFLETKDSCIGPGFYQQNTTGGVCYNCTSCSGVRDLADFSLSAPPAKRASPTNLGNDAGPNCDRLTCPYMVDSILGPQPYQGPMGYQGHCESHIAGSANWDLKNALVASFGSAGWGKMDAIWYKSLTPSKSAYQVASGGKCNLAATVNGCGATNWYTVYLASDDNDGNLANGTPNACRIWDAFNAHGIACGTRPVCTDTGTPDFTLAATTATQTVCPGNTANYSLQIGQSGGFSAPVTLALSGQPAGATPLFTPNPVTPGTSATLAVATGAGVAPGSHTLTVAGSASGSPGHTLPLSLVIGAAASGAPTLSAPADGATGVPATPQLSWQSVAGATAYKVELASDAAFSTIVASADNLTATQWTGPTLQGETQYYWRVTAKSPCGTDQLSTVARFTTAVAPTAICRTPAAAIPDNNTTGVSDSQTVVLSGNLTDLDVSVDITHPYVGDLSVILTKGSTSVTLMQRPGNAANTGTSGCNGNNADVIIDDAATLTLESNCASDPNPAYTTDAAYKPNNALSAFVGTELSGEWTVRVVDAANQDAGTLNGWCLLPSVASGPDDRLFTDGFEP